MVNTVAGGGSLLTFPMLLALGYPALQANVTNSVGVLPGNISGTGGYRRELRGQRDDLVRCSATAAVGAAVGAVLLVHTPAAAFRAIVPALIAVAAVMVMLQPAITLRLQARRAPDHRPRRWAAPLGVGIVAVYGGYFGAAMGVMLIALLGVLLPDSLLRTNALKTAITVTVNGLSALIFAFFAPVAWGPAITLGAATVTGGYAGAGVARRLPDTGLRAVIVLVGLAAAVTVALRG